MYAGKNDGLKLKMGNENSKVVKRETPADYDVKNGLLEEDKTKIGVDCGGGGSGKKGSSAMRCCQAEKCSADLSDAKHYHWRHKVCEYHAKAQVVLVGGIRQRFCQQCSRFHELAEFDDMKRSCRRRLAGHNERRRKNCESQSEGSSRKGSSTRLKDTVCGLADDRGRIQKTIQESATYKHFQIRLR